MTATTDQQQLNPPSSPAPTPLPVQDLASPGTVLVLGATGKTGSRVTSRPRGLGVGVRATSRTGRHTLEWSEPCTHTFAELFDVRNGLLNPAEAVR